MGTQPVLCSKLYVSQPQLLLVTWAFGQVLLGDGFTLRLYLADPLKHLASMTLLTSAFPREGVPAFQTRLCPLAVCLPGVLSLTGHSPHCIVISGFMSLFLTFCVVKDF